MIPQQVSFTELQLDPRDLLCRKWQGVWPATWTRHQFVVANSHDDPLPRFDRWMASNIQGRWASYSIALRPGERLVCVGFELLNEAIMFRLKEGETAWREDEDHQ